jgi:hypothetical protein
MTNKASEAETYRLIAAALNAALKEVAPALLARELKPARIRILMIRRITAAVQKGERDHGRLKALAMETAVSILTSVGLFMADCLGSPIVSELDYFY